MTRRFLYQVIAVLFMFVNENYCFSQTPQLSQFYSSPVWLNPAFAGSTVQGRAALNYRLQWPNVPGGFKTFQFSFDHNLNKDKSGFAVQFLQDKAGSGGLTYTQANVVYAHRVRVSVHNFLRFGGVVSVGQNQVRSDALMFGDQLLRGGGFASVEAIKVKSAPYVDAGAGIAWHRDDLFWLGVSTRNLTQPRESLRGNDVFKDVYFNVHGGVRIKSKNNSRLYSSYFIPTFSYTVEGVHSQFNLGFYVEREPIVFGVWYRGLPILSNTENNRINPDALILLVGIKKGVFKFGYSYDLTISQLNLNSGGAHELSLIIEYATKKKSLSKRKRVIPCPKF